MNWIKKINKEKAIKVITITYLFVYCLLLLIIALLANIRYAEIDSYSLPVISMQYRGSLTMQPSDLELAQRDFPELYSGVNSYDDLRSSKLVRSADDPDVWLSYYFPLYGMASMPFKLLLQICGLPQVRAFTLTNVFSVIIALLLVVKCLKIPDFNKLVLLLIVTACPLPQYISFISSEVLMYSMVLCALVLFHEKHYHLSAILIMLASWMNPTVLLFGLAMIAEFFVNLFRTRKKEGFRKTILSNFWYIVRYGLCYIGFVVPFVFNYIYSKTGNKTFSGAAADGLLDRFGAYFFDLNFGFASFALIVLAAVIITLPLLLKKKRFDCLYYYAGLVFVVIGYSIMYHINCGMIMCSRYVLWSYPMLAFIAAVYSLDAIKGGKIRTVGCALTYLLMVGCVIFNAKVGSGMGGNAYTDNSNLVKVVMNTFPELYNPLPSTFYSRVEHIDGGYNNTFVSIYTDSETDEVRKVILLGNAENKESLRQELCIVSGDAQALEEIIRRIPEDNQYHYLNFNIFSSLKLRRATPEDKNILKASNTICEFKDMNNPLSGNGQVAVYHYETPLSSNTTYKIHISLDKESLRFNEFEIAFVDFYGPDYDSEDQEIKFTPSAKKGDYDFYINSGSVPDETGLKSVRFVVVSGKPVVLNEFAVTEMREATMEEKMSLQTKEQLCDLKDLDYAFSGGMNVATYDYQFSGNSDTIYKIETTFDEASIAENNIEYVYIDLYGRETYDRIEQQVMIDQNDIADGSACVFINSGNIPEGMDTIYARVVAKTENPIKLETFAMAEMEPAA